ncbi:MAG: dienelactone hydrolase family protein, partial [Candidatus Lambdaproteobacteria bacterium]|nr:dienelactone hydrolase family protein [Candidatus Lambdaproteobacteria bacterium]
VRHLVEVHPGTHHGYQFPERGVYHKVAAERSWERIFAMFHRQIPAYT